MLDWFGDTERASMTQTRDGAGEGATQPVYEISCCTCQMEFDALQASWCSCIVSERTLVCPACFACFCKAPLDYKRRVWSGAPRALWDRKLQEHRPQPELPPNPDPGEIQRPFVLLLDDEPDIRRVAARIIRSLGYGLITGRDGSEGLELARRYLPDLVLTDALMPKLDGRELCRRLKNDPETAGIKVVVMTGLYTSLKYETEAFLQQRVDGFLRKPLDLGELRDVLEKHLG